MSTKQDRVHTNRNSQSDFLANAKPGDTFTINDGGEQITIRFDGWNADGSANLTDSDGSYVMVPVPEGTDGAVEFGGKWWMDKADM